MDKLSDYLLLETLEKAKKQNLNKDFIALLESEKESRGL